MAGYRNIKIGEALTCLPQSTSPQNVEDPASDGREGGTRGEDSSDMYRSQTPGYIFKLCRKLRQEPTITEKLLWDHLRSKRFKDLKFRRQHPIGRYIADFYCREARLVIELDGNVHKAKDRKEYDRNCQEIIETRGIRVLRFKNTEIERNIEKVLQKISSFTPPSYSLFQETERGKQAMRFNDRVNRSEDRNGEGG